MSRSESHETGHISRQPVDRRSAVVSRCGIAGPPTAGEVNPRREGQGQPLRPAERGPDGIGEWGREYRRPYRPQRGCCGRHEESRLGWAHSEQDPGADQQAGDDDYQYPRSLGPCERQRGLSRHGRYRGARECAREHDKHGADLRSGDPMWRSRRVRLQSPRTCDRSPVRWPVAAA